MRRRPNISDREHQRRASQRAWSIRDFCKRYNVGRTTANQEIKEGKLKAKKVRRRTLIGDDDAEEWWLALPAIEVVADEADLEPRTQDESAGDRRSTERASSVPTGVAKPLTRDEKPSAGNSQLGPATTEHAAVWRRRRRRSSLREARGPPSS